MRRRQIPTAIRREHTPKRRGHGALPPGKIVQRRRWEMILTANIAAAHPSATAATAATNQNRAARSRRPWRCELARGRGESR